MRARTDTRYTVGAQLMFVHRRPTASSGLGPGRLHELRVDYQIADQERICPREPPRQRQGSPGPMLRPKRDPEDMFAGCSLSH